MDGPENSIDDIAAGRFKGGYMLHSPQSRKAAAKLSMGYMVATAAIIIVLAIYSGHFSFLTAGTLAYCAATFAIMRKIRWAEVSLNRLTWVYWASVLAFVVVSLDFGMPDVLLGLFPSLLVLTDAWWYRRSVMVFNLVVGFGIFTVGSIAIDGQDAFGPLMIEVPLLVAGVVTLASISNKFVSLLFRRQHVGGTVMSLMHALHARDGYTKGHSESTLAMALAVADRLEFDDDERTELADVALMHDIGKIGIPSAILQKPDRLDADEWEAICEHPVIGAQIIGDLPGFAEVARAIRHEHERWDGGGYPDGIAGEEIPLASRIVLACDAFQAMTCDRPYREAMTPEQARAELIEHAGTQFDPAVVRELLAALDSGIEIDSINAGEERPELSSIVERSLARDADQNHFDDDGTGSRHHDFSLGAVLGDEPGMADRRFTTADNQEDAERLSMHAAAVDPGLMLASSVRGGLLSAVVAAAYVSIFHGIDVFGIAFVGWFLSSALLSVVFDKTKVAEVWYLLLTVAMYVITPVAALHFNEPSVMMFVLLPATAGMSYFWNRRWIRVAQIVLALASFAVLPIALFGFSEFPRAIVGLRAFPGTIVVVGYLTERLWQIRFERGRFVSTVRSLLVALQARDGYTGDHSEETLTMVMGVADQLGLGEHERNELADVALLHDVGKIGIPDSILNKPGKLNDDEWVLMRKHPQIGQQIVAQVPGFEDVAKAIRHEHERWDGGGYPDGISGEQIPLASRIVLVCDAYHAMMSDRPYRKSLGLEIAREELQLNAGTQFDPRIVNALLAAIDAQTGEVVGGVAVSSEDKSESDVDHSSMEGIGMSLKAGWYASSAIYMVAGLSYIPLSLATASVPSIIGILAVVAVCASLVWLLCARLAPHAKWGPHVRILFGISLIGTVDFTIGGAVSAVVPLMMFAILASAYLHTAKIAIPYCMLGVVVAAAAVLASPEPATATGAFVTLVTFGSLVLAAVYSQYQLRKVAELNHDLSVTDALTGCANVRRLRSRLTQDLLGASRSQYRVALFAIDLDDFKQVNDRFSHTKGDELLKAVAEGLQSELEPGDLLVRRGGDEFAVVAPVAEGRDLAELRNRLASAIEIARKAVCPQVNPKGSVGYVIHHDGETADELLIRSDDALHDAKLDAHPDRRISDDGATLLNGYRRSIAVVRHGDRGDHEVGSEQEEDLRVARWVQRLFGTAMAWHLAAWAVGAIAATFAVAAVTGLANDLTGSVSIASIVALAAIAPFCIWASRRELSTLWLQLTVVVMFGLITAVVSQLGHSRPDFVDVYLPPIMFAFYFLTAKQAVPYLVTGLALFSATLYSSDYTYSTARVVMTALVVMMIVGMLAKARKATRAFAARAVEMSVVDPLTGAANLRGLRQRISDEIARSELSNKAVAVLGIDIDDFKSVNDRYNHARGDEVLRATADAVRKCLRTDELVSRRGGDEFAVVCAVDSSADIERIADRIRESIITARFKLCPDLLPTASVGVAIWKTGESIDDFMARVDDCLHEAKLLSRSNGMRVRDAS